MSNPVIDSNFDVAYSSRIGAIVSLNSKANDAQGEQRTKQAVVKTSGSSTIELWGDSNTFPQEVIDDVEKNIELSRALEDKTLLASSLKLVVGTLAEDGSDNLVPLEKNAAAEVRDFLRKTAFNTYKYECVKDLVYFYNAFPEIILSKDRSKIVQIATRQAEQCRWSKQNPQTGYFDRVYINANWKNGGKPEDENTINLPVLDPYYDPATALKSRTDSFQYILPINLATPGRDKYQMAPWNAVRASGWLDVSASIPELKKSILKNLTILRYHIEFSNLYWEWKYPNWVSIIEEERKKLREINIEAIEECLQGFENAGKNVITSFKSDPITGKDWPGVKITAIDKKIQDDLFLKDDERSSSKVLSAIGLHPALLGFSTATGQGQGGGSDIREAYNLNTIKDSIIHEKVLEPLYLVRDYNGWDPNIEFRLQPVFMTTLDKGKEVTNSNTTK